MAHENSPKEMAEFISNDIRLKTFPVAVKFLKDRAELPEKTRRPSIHLGKRVTICQGMTMARVYGWTVGLTREDLICVPAMLAFSFTGAEEPAQTLAKLFCEVSFLSSEEAARKEVETMSRFDTGQVDALLLAPAQKALFAPDTVAVYGNPAQVTRMIQGWIYQTGERVRGHFGGKVECTEYLIAPFMSRGARVAIPGMGDRIFSMTQDEEMVFSLPGSDLPILVEGLKEAGKKIGARYPITFYQNFQPEFPKPYKDLAEALGL